jgi:hypothetical protein
VLLCEKSDEEFRIRAKNSYSIERRLVDYVPTAFYGAVMVVTGDELKLSLYNSVQALCCCAIKCTGSVCNAIGHHQTKLGRAQHYAISVQSTKG